MPFDELDLMDPAGVDPTPADPTGISPELNAPFASMMEATSNVYGSPDEFVEYKQLADYFDTTVDIIKTDPGRFRSEKRNRDAYAINFAKNYPAIYTFGLDPNNAAIINDDFNALMEAESLFKNLGRSIGLGYDLQAKGVQLRGAEMTPDKIEDLVPMEALPIGFEQEAYEMSRQIAENFGIKTDEELQAAREEATVKLIDEIKGLLEEQENITPKDLNWIEQGIRSGIESLAIQAPGFAMMLASGGRAAPLLITMGAQTTSSAYAEGRAEGLNERQALLYSYLQGAIEVGTEILPTKTLERILGTPFKGDLTKEAIRFIIQEMGTEQLATLGQTAVDIAYGLDEQMAQAKTLEEKMMIQLQRQAVTAVATIVAGGAQLGAATTINKGIQQYYRRDYINQTNGENEQATLDSLNNVATVSKTSQRSKETFKQFLQTTDGDNNTHVFVDPVQLSMYLEQFTAEQIAKDPGLKILNDQLVEAKSSGADIQIPVADFGAHIAGTEHFEALRPGLTLNEDSVSPIRQEQERQSNQAFVQNLINQAQQNAEEYQQAQAIFDDVKEKLIETGRYNREMADAMARVVPAWATVHAQATGKTLEQVYRESGLTIEGPMTGRPFVPEGVLTQLEEGTAEYEDAPVFFDRARDKFLEVLPEDAIDEEVTDAIESGLFTPEYTNLLNALQRDDWLGFDYPSQAVNAVFSGEIGDFEVSPGLKQAVGKAVAAEFRGENVFRQSASLRKGTETLKRFGLDPAETHKTRDVAAALETRQRKKYGKIERDDRSPQASRKIADWMVQEVLFELENPEKSGVGWYSEKFQRAIDTFGMEFPELYSDQNARNLFTALIAITSDGQKVVPNFAMAADLYANYRQSGELKTSRGHIRQDSIDINVQHIKTMIEEYGLEGMHEYLMEEMTVSELNKIAREAGLKFTTGYTADVTLPRAALIFGPKLGAFYANLMGAHGYLTMDRWWSRTFNRYRGSLLTAPTPESLNHFRELIGEPEYSDDQVLSAIIEPQQNYEKRKFKTRLAQLVGKSEPTKTEDKEAWHEKAKELAGEEYDAMLEEHNIERAANTIYKAAFVNLEDAPFNATDRNFMLEAVNKAAKSLKRKGHDISIADIQAILWYYEKRLYGELGARQTADISYEEAATKVISDRSAGRPTQAGLEPTPVGEEIFGETSPAGPETLQFTVDERSTISYIENNGGISFTADGRPFEADKGFITTVRSIVVNDVADIPGRMVEFANENQGLLDQLPDAIIGAFKFDDGTGRYSIDLNIVIQDKDQAIKVGTELNQDSIWDIENGELVDTAGKGDTSLSLAEAYDYLRNLGYDVQDTDARGGETAGVQEEGAQRFYQSSRRRLRASDIQITRGYGEQREGAVSVSAFHYSKESRQELTGDKYGTGKKGAENQRLQNSDDDRIKNRIHFYVDTGSGVEPEGGVGGYVHAVQLNNLYDIDADPLDFKGQTADLPDATWFNAVESLVIDNGFDGVLVPRAQGNQGVAVLLGDNQVGVDELGTVSDVMGRQLRQEDETETKGYYDPANSLIRLTEASDASTFLHEFAHFMYDMEKKSGTKLLDQIHKWFLKNIDAVIDEAVTYNPDITITRQMADDYLTQGTSYDTDADLALERAVHEQFARGFEKYLMEGKAPSEELRGVFRKFARWLTQVYESIKGDMKVNIDAELRSIFDRLLATEEEIALAEARKKYAPMFTDAAMAGMTEEEFTRYKEQQEKVKDKQSETLRDKLIKELTRQTKKWWNDEKRVYADDFKEELREEQVYKASDTLKNSDLKLNHQAVKDLYGEETTDKRGRTYIRIPGKLVGMTAKDGIDLETAAASFGYESGDQMIKDIIQAPSITQEAETRAEAKMVEKHGDILNDGTIAQAADDAIQNNERGKLMLMELKALNKKINLKTEEAKAFKDMAYENIGKLNFRQIFPGKYRKAELKAAQESAVAYEQGDLKTAAEAKMRQVLNYYLGMAATEAKNDTMKIVDQMARYRKKRVVENIVKAGNGYWDQLERLLARFEFKKSATLKEIDEFNAWMQDRIENHGDGLMASPEALNNEYRAHWKNVPYAKLRGVADTIKNIEHVARYSDKITRAEEALEFRATADQLAEHILNNGKVVYKPERTTAVERKRGIGWAMASLTKIPMLVSWLDGGQRVGQAHDLLMQPMNDAQHDKMRLWDEVAQPIVDLIKNRTKEDVKRHNTKIHIPEIQDENNDGNLYGHQILAVALNVGNQSNLRKLLLGEGWADPAFEEQISIDNPKLQAVLQYMTKTDWDMVQEIWDQMEKLYPRLADIHEKTTGLRPPKVERTEVNTPFGTYSGGYYPMKYDGNRSDIAQKNEEKMNSMVDSMFSTTGSIQASVNAGATNERTRFYAPVKLHLNVIMEHFNETIQYIAFHDAVRQVNKLLRDSTVKKAIEGVMGPDEYAVMTGWLMNTAKDGRQAEKRNFIDAILGRLRFGTTLGVMGFKLSTGIAQVFGLSTAMAELGSANVLRAIRTITTDGKSSWEFVTERSKTMSHRMKTMDREIMNAMKELSKNNAVDDQTGLVKKFLQNAVNVADHNRFLEKAQEASMKHIAMIQTYMVDLPTWLAAYDKGIKEWNDEGRAIKYADWAVENLQGSGLPKDMSEIMSSKNEAIKMFTMFMTYFSSLWNLERDVARGAKSGNYSMTDIAARAMFLLVVPTIMEMILRGELDADDDDEESRAEKLLIQVALTSLNGIPLINGIANGLLTDYGYNMNALAQVIGHGTRTGDMIAAGMDDDKEVTKSQVKSTTKFLGAILGIPGVNQAWATGEHIYDVMENGEEITIRELVYGPKR